MPGRAPPFNKLNPEAPSFEKRLNAKAPAFRKKLNAEAPSFKMRLNPEAPSFRKRLSAEAAVFVPLVSHISCLYALFHTGLAMFPSPIYFLQDTCRRVADEQRFFFYSNTEIHVVPCLASQLTLQQGQNQASEWPSDSSSESSESSETSPIPEASHIQPPFHSVMLTRAATETSPSARCPNPARRHSLRQQHG